MPPKKSISSTGFDPRIYLGVIIFRWKLIAACFLWSIFIGVVYLRVAEKKYTTAGQIRITRDGMTALPSPLGKLGYEWTVQVINSRCATRAAERLRERWVDSLGGAHKLQPHVSVAWVWGAKGILNFAVSGSEPHYAQEYLQLVMEEHRAAWHDAKKNRISSVTEILDKELLQLAKRISDAEEEVINYQRVHRLPVIDARASLEESFLSTILARKNQLKMEQFLIETQHPLIRDANAGVLHNVNLLTRETGQAQPIGIAADVLERLEAMAEDAGDLDEETKRDPLVYDPEKYTDVKIRYYLAQAKEEELAARFEPKHPQLQKIRNEIAALEKHLDVGRRVQLESLMDRNSAINHQLKALEDAEYQWEGQYYQTSRLKAEFGRVKANLGRYESAYHTIYSRVFDVQVSEEMKSEHYSIISPAHSNFSPSWPDTRKILLIALVVGLGSGFGLAFVMQFVDNKVQTIRDVEDTLGLPFLGGIPFWVHSDLERTIRPIVTEEFSAGAVEAYRALRTSILTAADKVGEKILIMTSADSKEGKTLTTLNLAIMIAQAGKKVLVADMDLRRGRLHRSLETKRAPGITEALHDGRSLREITVPTRYEHLDFAPSGENKEQVAENLYGCDLKAFFAEAEREYDYVLVDTAPVLRVTDTVILASQQLGVVVYVAHVNRTPKPLIRYSLNLLTNARIIGVIMNSIEMHTISGMYYSYQYPNYAYYSNAYAYGYTYGYYHEDNDTKTGQGGSRRGRKWRKRIAALRQGEPTGIMNWVRRHLLPTD